MTNRLRSVDIAKGIAIICIILGHLKSPEINRVVFTFHVPIFFFITGYFTSDKRTVKEHILKKARTLLVPYFATCLIIIILGTIKGYLKGDATEAFLNWTYASLYGAGDNYTEPFYIKGIGAIWFLWATFWGSCILRISLSYNKWLRLITVAAAFAIGYYSRALFWFPLSIQAGLCAVLFMYIGYLLKISKSAIKEIPKEAKLSLAAAAVYIWFLFIRDFQTFWLVHCDVGRGVIDIIGCMCASAIVMLISMSIDTYTNKTAGFFAFFGKYSLLVLCIHIVELSLFPWSSVVDAAVGMGFPEAYGILIKIAGKLIFDLTGAYLLSHVRIVRAVLGMK